MKCGNGLSICDHQRFPLSRTPCGAYMPLRDTWRPISAIAGAGTTTRISSSYPRLGAYTLVRAGLGSDRIRPWSAQTRLYPLILVNFVSKDLGPLQPFPAAPIKKVVRGKPPTPPISEVQKNRNQNFRMVARGHTGSRHC